jgi:hypothetical protein
MMISIRKLGLMVLVLAIAVAALMTVYPQQKPDEKPTKQKADEKLPVCDCYFPNSKEYGVKKDGKCVVTKCQKKTPEKKDT